MSYLDNIKLRDDLFFKKKNNPESKWIVISPISRKTLENKPSPKNYPYWDKLIMLMKQRGYKIIQLGVGDENKFDNVDKYEFNKSLKYISKLLKDSYLWISVDNFLHHLAWYDNIPGIVIWGMSDPLMFGHEMHTNLLKDRKYLREDQHRAWHYAKTNIECWIEPEVVLKYIK